MVIFVIVLSLGALGGCVAQAVRPELELRPMNNWLLAALGFAGAASFVLGLDRILSDLAMSPPRVLALGQHMQAFTLAAFFGLGLSALSLLVGARRRSKLEEPVP